MSTAASMETVLAPINASASQDTPERLVVKVGAVKGVSEWGVVYIG